MAEKFCCMFSQRTGSIIILSSLMMFVIQLCIVIVVYYGSSKGMISELGVWVMLTSTIIWVYFCILALLGVERKKSSYMKPALTLILTPFSFILINQIFCILNVFQLTNIKSTFTIEECLYSLILEAMLIYAYHTVHAHYEELKLPKKSIDQNVV